MKIAHLKRDGEFRPQMRSALAILKSTDSVRIPLVPPVGYDGSIQITVGGPAETKFEAEVNLSDPTRFPARIRAAATELRDQGLPGRFRITHHEGDLQVERIKATAFYWVNLGDSFKEVADHKFLWAPSHTQSTRGSRIVNAGWKHVPEVRRGDIIFCHESGQIIYVAIATSDAHTAPRPDTRTFGKWHVEGFKIPVDLEILKPPLDTEAFRADLINLYNERCDPRLFDKDGTPAQQYLISLPSGAGAAILDALGDDSIRIQEKISGSARPNNRTNATQRDAIVKARVGQGRFRKEVLSTWKNQCPVTKVDMPEFLIASHIVSWQLSNDEEKVDGFNGIALSPSVDKLFDKGYISFSDFGGLLVRECIRGDMLVRLGINPEAIISGLSESHKIYLRRHRQTHGFPEQSEISTPPLSPSQQQDNAANLRT